MRPFTDENGALVRLACLAGFELVVAFDPLVPSVGLVSVLVLLRLIGFEHFVSIVSLIVLISFSRSSSFDVVTRLIGLVFFTCFDSCARQVVLSRLVVLSSLVALPAFSRFHSFVSFAG